MIPAIIGIILVVSVILSSGYFRLPIVQNSLSQSQNMLIPTINDEISPSLTLTPIIQSAGGKPSITPKPLPTATTTSTKLPMDTNTSTPAPSNVSDAIPPVFEWMTGPADGSTVDFASFCFPMKVVDNVSKLPELQVRYSFDTPSWGKWTTNVAPCYQNVSNDTHVFRVQARDGAGNTSSPISRTFTVNTKLYEVTPASPTATQP